MHRHPCVFELAQRLIGPGRRRILSFGCSSGEEVRTLREVGAAGGANWVVHGLECKPELIEEARAADPGGLYATSARDLPPESYDGVFCMSVLCRFPDGAFSFAEFEAAAETVCRFVAPGGLLVLYNAQYDLRETRVAFEAVPGPPLGGSGFVPKFRPNGKPLGEAESRDVPLMFRRKGKT
jgi:SAM-dependent methyltransferase